VSECVVVGVLLVDGVTVTLEEHLSAVVLDSSLKTELTFPSLLLSIKGVNYNSRNPIKYIDF